ncbi:MAG: hypothetical protein NXH82_01245 [Rhodobacteraceae bacterium]|nr:hypothetical protein [Paracoccaceae bacterium]
MRDELNYVADNATQTAAETDLHSDVYKAAVAELKAEARRKEAAGYAVMAATSSYGETAMGDDSFAKISHMAKLFCIAFAFLAPSLLIWRVLL